MEELRETAAISERAATAAKQTGKMRVQFISPGWGSSGYYSPDVLSEAASNRIIPAGTHMYADHPSKTAREDRPERSIRDLMAVTTSDAQLSEDGALVGEVRVLAPYQELITDLKDHIGVSILGEAHDVYEGEAEGRRGRIISGLAKVNSVDFVTRAGRGGQVLELLENARNGELEEELGESVEVIPDSWLADGIHVELAEALEEIAISAAGVQGTAKLHAYWRHGEGAAKIRWGVGGDFQRCVDHLSKYVRDPKGYCAKMHKDVTGARPGHAAGEAAVDDDRTITVLEGSSGRYGVDEAGHTYRYKHGWIPLGHTDEDRAVAKLSLSQRQSYANHRSAGMSHEDALKTLVKGHEDDLKTAQKMGYKRGTSVHNNHSDMLKQAKKALKDHQASNAERAQVRKASGPPAGTKGKPPIPGNRHARFPQIYSDTTVDALRTHLRKVLDGQAANKRDNPAYKAEVSRLRKAIAQRTQQGTFHHGPKSANSSN